MKSFYRPVLLIPFLILLFTLAACTGISTGQPETVETPSPTKAAPSSTQLPLIPTHTSQPTATSAPVSTATPLPTPTLLDDISQVTLVAHGVLPNWNYLFTFGFAEKVRGNYRLVVDQNKDYTCATRSDQPTFLYCDGPMAAFDDYVNFELRTENGSLVVLTGNVYIPPVFTP